ncbi:MAG: succinate--CoA ligase subunit alpha [Candidatus Fermentibacteraceae bacterium]|nr:succinate--CoA ligase subunit alpha [Candidatus Fermentibacteraceae bacterium]MBN2608380.1 succinate--CoA ligase subunit alpha [Candidatus Fermentibacteraceae bacterium]
MSILIDEKTRVMVQGLGRDGSFHARQMKDYGTSVVAGVHPGRGGSVFEGIPVFDTADEAVGKTGAQCSVLFVPAPFASDAILESANAGVGLVVAVTEGIPVLDMSRVAQELDELDTRLVGPNCPGLISPGKSKVGIMPGNIFSRGPIGVISRSGTLTYEVVNQLSLAGYGQSTAIGMGGDPIVGMKYNDYLVHFERDAETELVVIVGEIGGTDEQDAAAFIGQHVTKPVVGYIVGRSAPPGKRMGHAGAIISGADSTAEAKVNVLREHGIPVADTVEQIVDLVAAGLGG